MSIAPRLLLPAAALVATLVLPTFTQAEDYDLVFDRPHAVGARYTVEGEAYINQEMQQRNNGEVADEMSVSSEINIEGVVEVLDVNDQGGITGLAMTVGEYDIDINDDGVELQADRRILGTVEGDEVKFRYENGDAIEGDLAELLDLFFEDLLDEDGDGGHAAEMMNIDGPKSPGDRWEMDHDFMVQNAEEDGKLTVDREKMESEVHFVEVNENNDFGQPMAVIEMSMRNDGFSLTADDFPEWMELKESYMEMEGSGMLPIDPASHQGRHEVEMEIVFLASGEVPGPGIKVEVEVEMSRGYTIVLGELP